MAMDDHERKEYEARAQGLRAHLKVWEADWAKSHDGRKPGREDIKNDPAIAQKYKDYEKLRGIISGKTAAPSTQGEAGSTKRKSEDVPSPVETPLKKTRQFETPSKSRAHGDSPGFMMSPAVSRKLFSPAATTSLGPTPQRDGKVLGLFDLLVEKELGISPHTKHGGGSGGSSGKKMRSNASNVLATPSKPRDGAALNSTVTASASKLGHTPRSHRANPLPTSLKKKDGTPSKLAFDTPAFLRRQWLPTLDEEESEASALRIPRKLFARGLSEIVASLRKVEDELADEELEALQEAQEGEGQPTTAAAAADVLAPERQGSPALLGGFDEEEEHVSPVEESGKPMRVFKKKGQKRTTRMVNIRPTRHKRLASPEREDEHDGDDAQDAAGSDDNFVDESTPDADRKTAKKADGKKTRKSNPLAHANFQRLKLRNKPSRGRPGRSRR